MAQKESKCFDKRTVDRYREKGLVTESEVQAHLKALPDDASRCEYVQMDLHDTELGDDSLDDDDEKADQEDNEADDEE